MWCDEQATNMVFLGCYRSDPLSTRFLHGTEQLQEVVVSRMGVGVGMDMKMICVWVWVWVWVWWGWGWGWGWLRLRLHLMSLVYLILILVLVLTLVHPQDLLTTCIVQRSNTHLDHNTRYNWMFVLLTCGEIVQAEVKQFWLVFRVGQQLSGNFRGWRLGRS